MAGLYGALLGPADSVLGVTRTDTDPSDLVDIWEERASHALEFEHVLGIEPEQRIPAVGAA